MLKSHHHSSIVFPSLPPFYLPGNFQVSELLASLKQVQEKQNKAPKPKLRGSVFFLENLGISSKMWPGGLRSLGNPP